jgi:hypothetical protein
MWRIVGVLALVAAGLMTGLGVGWERLKGDIVVFLGYWGLVLLLVGASFFIAVLDMRYIRLQYAIAKQKAFRETLGNVHLHAKGRGAQTESRSEDRAN